MFAIGAAEAEAAHAKWGANCGPAALAAIMGLTLDQVRPHMGDFESKGYTNPTLMFAALDSIGRRWRRARCVDTPFGMRWPDYGLVRVQWEGPWTAPGVPLRARYRFTHWVAAAREGAGVAVFDVNASGNGSGWCSVEDWESVVVPWILSECVPRATGGWHMTHVIEVSQ